MMKRIVVALMAVLMIVAGFAGVAQAACKAFTGRDYVCGTGNAISSTAPDGSRRYDIDTPYKQWIKISGSWTEVNQQYTGTEKAKLAGMDSGVVMTTVPGATTGVTNSNMAVAEVAATKVVAPTSGTSAKTLMRRTVYVSDTDVADHKAAEIYGTEAQVNRTTGFKVKTRFALDALSAANMGFFGLANKVDASTVDTNYVTQDTVHTFGLAFATNTGNWQLVHSDGDTVVALDLGATMALDTTSAFSLTLEAAAGAAGITYTVLNERTGASVTGTVSTVIPAAGTLLTARGYMSTGVTLTAASWSLGKIVVATP